MGLSRNRQLSNLLDKDTGLVKSTLSDSDQIVISGNKGIASTSAGTTVYAILGDLPGSASAGEQAFVSSNNGLYIHNGSGWYKVALVNSSPYWTTQPNSAYSLNLDGTATVITVLAGDSDGHNPVYTAIADSDFNQIATVTKDSDNGRVFTIIPTDSENGTAESGSGTITFKASDAISFASQVSTFTLTFITNEPLEDWTSYYVRKTVRGGAANDNFGNSVFVTNDYVAIGAKYSDPGSVNAAGSVKIYLRSASTWSLQQTLNGTVSAQQLGTNVVLNSSATYLIAGAFGETSNTGAAYIYTRSGSTWTQQQKLTAGSDAATQDYWGQTVAIDSDANWCAIGGVYSNGGPASGTGAVHTFSRSGSTWTQQQRLTGAAGGDGFGGVVKLSKDGIYLLVTSSSHDTGGSNAGRASIYKRSGNSFTLEQHLVPTSPTLAAGDQFGFAADLDENGTTAAIGALGSDDDFTNQGSVYIFTRDGSTWTQQTQLRVSNSDGGYGSFGSSLSLAATGNQLVGWDQYDNTAQGQIYIFERNNETWSRVRSIQSGDIQDGDYFGRDATNYRGTAIGISPNEKYIVVGAIREDGGSGNPKSNSGSAYWFEAN